MLTGSLSMADLRREFPTIFGSSNIASAAAQGKSNLPKSASLDLLLPLSSQAAQKVHALRSQPTKTASEPTDSLSSKPKSASLYDKFLETTFGSTVSDSRKVADHPLLRPPSTSLTEAQFQGLLASAKSSQTIASSIDMSLSGSSSAKIGSTKPKAALPPQHAVKDKPRKSRKKSAKAQASGRTDQRGLDLLTQTHNSEYIRYQLDLIAHQEQFAAAASASRAGIPAVQDEPVDSAYIQQELSRIVEGPTLADMLHAPSATTATTAATSATSATARTTGSSSSNPEQAQVSGAAYTTASASAAVTKTENSSTPNTTSTSTSSATNHRAVAPVTAAIAPNSPAAKATVGAGAAGSQGTPAPLPNHDNLGDLERIHALDGLDLARLFDQPLPKAARKPSPVVKKKSTRGKGPNLRTSGRAELWTEKVKERQREEEKEERERGDARESKEERMLRAGQDVPSES